VLRVAASLNDGVALGVERLPLLRCRDAGVTQ
jgi:hypothetical protein